MKDRQSGIATLMMVVCAVAVTGLLIRRELFAERGSDDTQGRKVPSWRTLANAGTSTGRIDAPSVVIEFIDFQCPACRQLSYAMDSLIQRHGSGIRVVRRHFPLQDIHPRALELARLGTCAAQQGVFDQFYRAAFDSQRVILASPQRSLLDPIPVSWDTVTAVACAQQASTLATVRGDISAGQELRITGTPTLIVNGRLYTGARSFRVLDSLVAVR